MGIIELVAGVVLASAAVWFVLRPIVKPEAAGRGTGDGGGVGEGEGDDPEDDLSARAVAVRALKEIEFDRATGKLSDADYDALRVKYTAEAIAALRAGEPGSGKREGGSVGAHPLPAPRSPLPVCSTCGSRPERGAVFCSSCGRRLTAAPGFCGRCGAGLEDGATYCAHCGVRVAA
jgi:hypothetical protein